MRYEIAKFHFIKIRRAAKFYLTNKPYRRVAGIDNLLVYFAKLTHAAANFMLLNFTPNLSQLKNTPQSRCALYMSVRQEIMHEVCASAPRHAYFGAQSVFDMRRIEIRHL